MQLSAARKAGRGGCRHSEQDKSRYLRDDLSETFGLGAEALTDHVFLKQFLNSSGTFEVVTEAPDAFSGATGEVAEVEGDTVGVDALTGATVTSKAIVRAINSAVAYVTGADAASAATTWGG